MSSEAVGHIPLYLQVEESLRSQISSGALPPYSQVPSEPALARTFGVSRMTARNAVDRLVSAGLAFRRAGKGTFVAPPKIARPLFSTQHSFGGAMSALGLEHQSSVLDATTVSAPPEVAEALQLPEGAIVVYVRRLRIVEGAPAALHSAYLPASYAGVLNGDLQKSLTETLDKMNIHVKSTRDTVEALAAPKDVAAELQVSPKSAVFRITGTSYTDHDIPVRYTEAWFRGDRFRLLLDSDRTESGEIEMVSSFGVLPGKGARAS